MNRPFKNSMNCFSLSSSVCPQPLCISFLGLLLSPDTVCIIARTYLPAKLVGDRLV